MRRLLLDTNVWALAMYRQSAIPLMTKDMIANAAEVSISTASIYEVGQKVRLGKWPEMTPFANDLIELATRDNCNILSIGPMIALTASLLAWDHRDPFDRIIAATALQNDLALVSSDAMFDSLAGIERIWA